MNRFATTLAISASLTLSLLAQDPAPPTSPPPPDAAIGSDSAADTDLLLIQAWRHYTSNNKDDALALCSRVIDAAPADTANAHFLRGLILADTGQLTNAIADFDIVLAQQPDHAEVCNAKAWVLCTAKDNTARNGTLALELATRAVQLTDRRDGPMLDTLAAAYAETGDFENALATQEEALKLLAHTPEAAGAAQRLELYRQRQPFRE